MQYSDIDHNELHNLLCPYYFGIAGILPFIRSIFSIHLGILKSIPYQIDNIWNYNFYV